MFTEGYWFVQAVQHQYSWEDRGDEKGKLPEKVIERSGESWYN